MRIAHFLFAPCSLGCGEAEAKLAKFTEPDQYQQADIDRFNDSIQARFDVGIALGLFARRSDVLDTSSTPLDDGQSNEQQTTSVENDTNEKSDESDIENSLVHPGNGNGHDQDPTAPPTNGNGTASTDQATTVADADNAAKRKDDRSATTSSTRYLVQLGPWLTAHRIRCSRLYLKRFFKSKSRTWATPAGR